MKYPRQLKFTVPAQTVVDALKYYYEEKVPGFLLSNKEELAFVLQEDIPVTAILTKEEEVEVRVLNGK